MSLTEAAAVHSTAPASHPVRIALIGAGRIGSNHAEIVARLVPGASLVAVSDPVGESAQRLATTLGAPLATTTVDDVLTSDEVDAVLITAPARSHTDLVVAAAAAGKHVFVEKPMAVTLADADRAIAAAADAGIVLQVGFNRRFAPGFAAARAAIDAQKVGTPQSAAFADPRSRAVHRRSGTRSAVDDLPRNAHSRLRHPLLPQPRRTPGAGARDRRRPGATGRQERGPPRHRSGDRSIRQRCHRHGRGELQRAVRIRRARRGIRLRRHGHRRQRAQHRHDLLRPRRAARRHRAPRHRPPALRLRGGTDRLRRRDPHPHTGRRHRPGRPHRAVDRTRRHPQRRDRRPPSTWTGDPDGHVHARRQRRNALPRPAVPGPRPPHRRTRTPGRDLGLVHQGHRRPRRRSAPNSPR